MTTTLIAALAATTVINVTPGPKALENAQRQVRALLQEAKKTHSTNAVEVVLSDGVYRLSEALSFGPKDSGTKGNPVIWRAAHRGQAFVRGSVEGEEIAIDWTKSPATLIPEASRPHVRAYRVPGEKALPGWRNGTHMRKLNEVPLQVHCGGERCTVATFPKKGYIFTGKTVYPVRDSYNQWGENWYANFDGEFYVNDVPQFRAWAGEPDLWTFGMWRFEWAPNIAPVVKIDAEKMIMGVETNQAGYGFLPNQPYNVFNAFSEIKAAGDWALDRKTRQLYVWAPNGAKPEISMADNLFSGRPSDVIFQDLVLEHARGGAIFFENANRVTVRASLIRGVGGTGVTFKSCGDMTLYGCDLFDLGGGGVGLQGGGLQQTLAPSGIVVENCHIHHVGLMQAGAAAVHMSGVGTRVQHNLIHHCPHTAVSFRGNDLYVGFNMIHDAVQYNNDAGALYCNALDWAIRGSVVEYNCIFMSGKQPLSSHVNGIYCDSWSSGMIVRGNIINRAGLGIYMSGGNDNIVTDNLVLNAKCGINLSSLGADSFAARSAREGRDSFLYKQLLKNEKLYRSDLWRKRYPRMIDLLEMKDKVDAHNAYWYVCTNNVMCSTGPLRVRNAAKVLHTHVMRNNLEMEGDPGFVDYAGFNWELREDSPVRKLHLSHGTRFGEMGLYASEWRFSPAVRHGEKMSKPRPIRIEHDQGTVLVKFHNPANRAVGYRDLNTVLPDWKQHTTDFTANTNGPWKISLQGGAGYKTMYDDVEVFVNGRRVDIGGDFEDGGKGWWPKQPTAHPRPSSDGEFGTPCGVVEDARATSGRFVALANDGNPLISKTFEVKSNEVIRVNLKARQYVPEHIRPYWNKDDK